MRCSALRDDQWEKLKPLLLGKKTDPGRTAKNNRLFIHAVLYRYRVGIPWRDLPEKFGDFRVIHTRYCRWAEKGVWAKIFKVLSEDSDNEYAMIDSTVIRAHQHSAGAITKKEAIGKSSGGPSTKIHAICDALGNPTDFCLTAGQVHDLVGADILLPSIKAKALLADKAYYAEERVIKKLQQRDIIAIIPPKSNIKKPKECDSHLYKSRHLIENLFCKLKQYRAIATRYDKNAQNFLAAVYLASCIIWLH